MGADKIWIPETARPSRGTHTCRICGEKRVEPEHMARCFRRHEDVIRAPRAEQNGSVLAHPEPDLEDFMHRHGGLNRPAGERKRAR